MKYFVVIKHIIIMLRKRNIYTIYFYINDIFYIEKNLKKWGMNINIKLCRCIILYAVTIF